MYAVDDWEKKVLTYLADCNTPVRIIDLPKILNMHRDEVDSALTYFTSNGHVDTSMVLEGDTAKKGSMVYSQFVKINESGIEKLKSYSAK